MTALLHLVVLLLLVGTGQSQVVDRMVAVVNKRVILESELDQAARVEFLMQGKPIESLAQTDRGAVLERLIDRALLDQQIVNPAMLDPTPEELAAKIKEVRSGIPGAATNEGWNALLAGYGLTQPDVEEQVTSEIRILRLIDLRFRGLVRVEKEAIAAYYQDHFLPELRKRKAAEPKLSEVSDKIEQVLIEQEIDNLLSGWLKTLRAQAHIEKMLPAAPLSGAGAGP
ncbi:MAG TPA: SurA N-terminal domain-containing protein [Candidatus Angelobacter sp.]|jgi:parvulin-like peptidyl-prolyl isomerase|nr:SurA N-terminal domain-containing protein [Candidatus Angelobacter sp.]